MGNIAYAEDAETKPIKILIIGDSLTAGYGVEKEEAFPAILEKKIHKLGHTQYQVVNGGVSGSTTASGKSRLKWFLKGNPKIMLLALGANDGLRGLKLEQSKKNLEEIIKKAKSQNIKVVLGGMQIPTNYGKDYRKQFQQMYQDLSKQYEIPLIPFLLDGVGGHKELNIADGIHPNAKGHEKVATTVLKYLEPLL
jgi:acyl-CoA thioesterase-1